MKIKEHFCQIKNFLKSHESFWREEVLNSYPASMEAYPTSWIGALGELDQKELWEVDSQRYIPLKEPTLKHYLEEVRKLTKMRRIEVPSYQLRQDSRLGMTPKKIHEVSLLVPLIDRLYRNHKYKRVLDIGGGKGHLCKALAWHFDIPSICLEPDEQLILAGKKLLEKSFLPQDKISFVNGSLGDHIYALDIKRKEAKVDFCSDTLALGIHCCGPLSLRLMERSSNFINLGCCYQKLGPKTELNISKEAKKDPLQFSTHSLTLASKNHASAPFFHFQQKWRVKSFRYTLHLLLYHHFGISTFTQVNPYPLKKYGENFAEYVAAKLQELGLKNNRSNAFYESFYQKIHPLVKKMFLANIIRWQSGRLLEIYITLDRCLYLEEQGLNVQVGEIFSETISPRNLAIICCQL
jgi:hypothetical protein